jgi:hypothetical protein
LLFHGRRLVLLSGIGLHRAVDFLDDAAEHRRLDLVSVQDFRDFADVDLGHG